MTERSREIIVESPGALEPWSAVATRYTATRYTATRYTAKQAAGRGATEFEVSPDSRREQIAGEARNAIFWDLAVPRNRVSVHCDYGWLTLTGVVERAYQRSAAEADVLRVPGVRGVTNAIIVRAQDETPTSPIAAA
jgi:osmotically-inducible protein OsmY